MTAASEFLHQWREVVAHLCYIKHASYHGTVNYLHSFFESLYHSFAESNWCPWEVDAHSFRIFKSNKSQHFSFSISVFYS